MYAIFCGGALVSLCDKPRYIKRNQNGIYVEADAADAIGVSVSGNLLNINGGNAIPNAPEAVIAKKEGGEVLFRNMERVDTVNQTTSIAFVTMAESGSIDDVTAGEHPDMFSRWAYPVLYKAGNIRRYGSDLYRCLQDHTSQADWAPDTAVSLWVKIADPTEEWPEWSQPVGAHDAYSAGDKVTHNGKHWTSDIDANVWEPGMYGWTEVVG